MTERYKFMLQRLFLPEFPNTGNISLGFLLEQVNRCHMPSTRELGRYFVRYAEHLEQEQRGLVLFRSKIKKRHRKKYGNAFYNDS